MEHWCPPSAPCGEKDRITLVIMTQNIEIQCISASCLLPYFLSASVSFFSSDSCLTFDLIVRPCVEDDLLRVLAKAHVQTAENFRSYEKEVTCSIAFY